MVAVAAGILAIGTVLAGNPAQESTAPVFWAWEGPDNSLGTSKLVRNSKGVSADFSTSGLTAGHAMTLWFIVFNYPDLCVDGCDVGDLGPDSAAQGDFLVASGHVIDEDGNATFGGRLKVGDISGSGLHEVACPETKDCGIGLIEPDTALVVLAVHSHGPAQKGQVLKEQISSFTGGCEFPFLGGDDGIADGPGDVPVDDGYCSTIQMSPHAPSG